MLFVFVCILFVCLCFFVCFCCVFVLFCCVLLVRLFVCLFLCLLVWLCVCLFFVVWGEFLIVAYKTSRERKREAEGARPGGGKGESWGRGTKTVSSGRRRLPHYPWEGRLALMGGRAGFGDHTCKSSYIWVT